MREAARLRHLSRRTEQAYVQWVRRFVRFHGLRHPRELGKAEVEAFLSDLATRRRVSASTQNQALAALLFLYRHVLDAPLPWLQDVVRAKRPLRLPVVLTRDEVRRLLEALEGVPRLVALVIYGGGLRLTEALNLWVQDLDLSRGEVMVRGGQGGQGSAHHPGTGGFGADARAAAAGQGLVPARSGRPSRGAGEPA